VGDIVASIEGQEMVPRRTATEDVAISMVIEALDVDRTMQTGAVRVGIVLLCLRKCRAYYKHEQQRGQQRAREAQQSCAGRAHVRRRQVNYYN
jgi:hypothetical protein